MTGPFEKISTSPTAKERLAYERQRLSSLRRQHKDVSTSRFQPDWEAELAEEIKQCEDSIATLEQEITLQSTQETPIPEKVSPQNNDPRAVGKATLQAMREMLKPK